MSGDSAYTCGRLNEPENRRVGASEKKIPGSPIPRLSDSKKRPFVLTLLLLLLGASPAWAGTSGKIVGRVLDAETGETLPGANVIVVGTTSGAATDLDGEFLIINIAPGRYRIQVSMLGYQTRIVENVVVQTNLTTRLPDVILFSEAITMNEEVVVVAQREMITKDMTATQSVIGADEIDALPVEEFADVVQLQAGVTKGRDGQLHIRGGRSEEVVYMVDGMAISDVYSGEIAVEVENASVQELQVISGTFNAEYGRAMSGVVSIVTKEGGQQLEGSVTGYFGDYLTSDDALFPNIDDVDPSGVVNGQFSLSGPVPFTRKKLKFFVTGRFLEDDGYLFGSRLFNPSDSSDFSADDSTLWQIEATGDGAVAPLQFTNKQTLHGKLSYHFKPTMKLAASLMVHTVEAKDWSQEGNEFIPENQFHNFHRFQFNPDGSATQFRNGYTVLAIWNHLVNNHTFYNLSFSSIYNKEKSFVYEDPFDPRYRDPDLLLTVSDNAFYTGGTDPWHSRRSTQTYVGKFDITSQITKIHQLRAGVEVRLHELQFEAFKLIPARNENGIEIQPFQPALPPRESPFNNRYTHRPRELAVFIQDKIELDHLIINAGLRYDAFDPNASVPTDLRDPANRDLHTDASLKSLFSPRLGIAFPITDRGVLHFSYGYFFQMPLFQFLYANSEFEVEIGRLRTLMGNADLDPQKTIIYEVGLQQQLTDNLAFDFTVYYKDTRDLLGTQIYELRTGLDRYARYENRDFGTVRGFVFALNQRHSDWLSASVDYTFQVAEGNASEPNAAFIDAKADREPEKKLVPLDWDQRHTLTAALNLSPTPQARITLLGQYGSGLPYTPTFLNIRQAFENTARSPATLTFDLKADYALRIGGVSYVFFLKVFNIFDRRNELIVFRDTGRAGFTIQSRLTGRVRGINSIDEFFSRPDYFAPPRQIRFGVTIGF